MLLNISAMFQQLGIYDNCHYSEITTAVRTQVIIFQAAIKTWMVYASLCRFCFTDISFKHFFFYILAWLQVVSVGRTKTALFRKSHLPTLSRPHHPSTSVHFTPFLMQMDWPYHTTKAVNIVSTLYTQTRRHPSEDPGITRAFSYVSRYFKEIQWFALYIKTIYNINFDRPIETE